MSYQPYFKNSATGGVPRTVQGRREENFYVRDFGAKCDAVTDDTAAIQAAINACNAAGGGTVWFPCARIMTTGVLTLKQNVKLAGEAYGPFYPDINPMTTTVCPTILITNTVSPFISTTGGNYYVNSSISDLLFAYPTQVPVSSSVPTVFQPTIQILPASGSGGITITRCTFFNAYTGVKVEHGLTQITDSVFCCFNTDINIDRCFDWCLLSNLEFITLFDQSTGTFPPSNMDTGYCATHRVGIQVGRCDSLHAQNIVMFGWFNACVALTDGIVNGAQSRCGYGVFSNMALDFVGNYGINCQSSRTGVGYQITNLEIGGGPSAVGIWLPTGGTEAPLLSVVGGTFRGSYSSGNTLVQAGTLWIRDVYGLDQPGGLLSGAPAVPASTVAVANPFPYTVQVFINGSFTDVAINGASTGGPRGAVLLKPSQTIAITYPGAAPTWTWFNS